MFKTVHLVTLAVLLNASNSLAVTGDLHCEGLFSRQIANVKVIDAKSFGKLEHHHMFPLGPNLPSIRLTRPLNSPVHPEIETAAEKAFTTLMQELMNKYLSQGQKLVDVYRLFGVFNFELQSISESRTDKAASFLFLVKFETPLGGDRHSGDPYVKEDRFIVVGRESLEKSYAIVDSGPVFYDGGMKHVVYRRRDLGDHHLGTVKDDTRKRAIYLMAVERPIDAENIHSSSVSIIAAYDIYDRDGKTLIMPFGRIDLEVKIDYVQEQLDLTPDGVQFPVRLTNVTQVSMIKHLSAASHSTTTIHSKTTVQSQPK